MCVCLHSSLISSSWDTAHDPPGAGRREDESVLENLQRILEFKSPQHAHLDEGEKASNTTLEKGMVECGICYASTWNPPEEMEMEEDRMTSNGGAMAIGSLQGPDQFCSHCERPFHHPCLSEVGEKGKDRGVRWVYL